MAWKRTHSRHTPHRAGGLPESVSVHMPAVQCDHCGEPLHHDAVTLRLLFEMNATKKVWVECTPTGLEYIRVAAIAAAVSDIQEEAQRVRSAPAAGVEGVKCDKRRKTVFMVVNGKRLQERVDDWTPAYINNAAQTLRDRLSQDEELAANYVEDGLVEQGDDSPAAPGDGPPAGEGSPGDGSP